MIPLARRALPPLVLAAGLLAARASAHVGHAGVRVERFVKIDLGSDPPRLVYTLGLAGPPAAAERRLADANGDGAVDGAEADARAAALRAAVAKDVGVCTGRALEKLSCAPLAGARVLSSTPVALGAEARAPLAYEWVFALPLSADDAALRLDDAWGRDDLERTELSILPPPHRHMLRAGDAAGSGVSLELAWIDAATRGRTRSIVAAWDLPPRRWIVPAALVGAALAAALVALRIRRGEAPAARR